MKMNHQPHLDPCTKCKQPASRHYFVPYHPPEGDPCKRCGLPAAKHKPSRPSKWAKNKPPRDRHPEPIFLGIDGEGQGRKVHRYVLLACASEVDKHKSWTVENPEGLSTIQCLDFILGLPNGENNRYKLFAYSFHYDLTKILQDVDNESLYRLFRPEERKRKNERFAYKGPIPVHWHGYKLNIQGSKFTVAKGGRRKVIWDIFKFFQGKFVGALRDWRIANEAILDRMTKMKDQRAEFDKLDFAAVRSYCIEECQCMARLAKRLTKAHEQAGLRLRSYFGAGSSAGAMLTKMGIKKELPERDYFPPDMRWAIGHAFSGGRFENSAVGPIKEEIWSYDISSAYPYQLFFLPCLRHGRWVFTKNREDLDRPTKHALVRYKLGPSNQKRGWGPFPFRDRDGSISYPVQSGGGWVWREEYLTGEAIFPNIQFVEAWIYKQECVCLPFKKIAQYYLERCRIGKEGPGIVIKLGCNSCYGKLAQSVGSAPFNCWAWAGMITSGTRAQLLELYGYCRNPESAIMMATDGLCTTEKLEPPRPRNTGTWEAMVDGIAKPLGGWEEKHIKGGMFFARPGIYFPLNPLGDDATEQERQKILKTIRGRGVGRSAIVENWKKILKAWPPKDVRDTIRVSNVSRFCGAKSSIHRVKRKAGYIYLRARGVGKEPSYGQWISRPVEMSFDPKPKRERVMKDMRTLMLRKFPLDQQSAAYKNAIPEEIAEMKLLQDECFEQPDADWTEYE